MRNPRQGERLSLLERVPGFYMTGVTVHQCFVQMRTFIAPDHNYR